MPCPTQEKLLDILKTAISNSKAKKYHGGVDVTLQVPEPTAAITEILKSTHSILDLANEDKSDFAFEPQDPMWITALHFKYPWIQNVMKRSEAEESKISASEIAMLHHPSHFSEQAFDESYQAYFDFLSTHREFVDPTIN